MSGILNERRGSTPSGLRIEWKHYGRTDETGERFEWSIRCGAWEWESEEDYDLVWTWDRVAGLAACLSYIAGMGPEGAAALAATILRNMEVTTATEDDNVIQLRPRRR